MGIKGLVLVRISRIVSSSSTTVLPCLKNMRGVEHGAYEQLLLIICLPILPFSLGPSSPSEFLKTYNDLKVKFGPHRHCYEKPWHTINSKLKRGP